MPDGVGTVVKASVKITVDATGGLVIETETNEKAPEVYGRGGWLRPSIKLGQSYWANTLVGHLSLHAFRYLTIARYMAVELARIDKGEDAKSEDEALAGPSASGQ